MTLCLLADDLTGALDSAVQFTGAFGPLPVLLRVAPHWPSDSFALDLNCRDGSEDEAVSRARATAGRLAGAGTAFKKIDSLLRGHWAAELAAVAELRLFDRIVIAPAFPAQGRVMRGGRQHVLAGPHAGLVPVDPARELARWGIEVSSGEAASVGADASQATWLCDAASDDDLTAVAGAVRSLPGATLWCGSAGLARALAAVPPRAAAPFGSPHLVLIGSDHAVTRGQVDQVRRHHARCVVGFDADADGSAARVDHALTDEGRCVAVADLPARLAPADAMERIASWLRAMLPRIRRPAVLTVVGGETFAAVCRALDVGSLAAEGEWRPGIPVSRLVGGPWHGTPCVSKSGAFGAEDLFRDLLGAPAAVAST